MMDYYQQPRGQQYSVSSTSATPQQSSQTANSYMYGNTNNSMYYQQQSAMQQPYATTPQHYSSGGMGSGQTHGGGAGGQTAASAHSASHWNNGEYGVQQQPSSGTQQRRTTQPGSYGSYRSTAQTQPDPQTQSMGMGRPTHAHAMPQGPPGVAMPQQQDLPLRMVVEAKYVGAIIGQGGNNIRDITKESKARCVVDVQRAVRDSAGNIEKVISILGQPENCSKACVKILDVIQKEAEKDEKPPGEVELKLRAHNQLVGRLIGKQGATIKKIMQDTGTVIFVSNDPSGSPVGAAVPPMYDVLSMERTITVRAPTIQEVSAAEQKISAKLRQSFETDIASRQMAYGGMGMPGMPIMNPIGDAYAALASGVGMRSMGASNVNKTVRMYVPNSMVGAIIGTKGAHIRNIMRSSGAYIKIEGGEYKKGENREKADSDDESKQRKEEEKRAGAGEYDEKKGPDEERLVIITGNDTQQYRAQFCIFQRVAEQSNHYVDDVKLRTEVCVPSKLVGRIIGKGGQNVRELQRVTGAQVKIPDDLTDEAGASEKAEGGEGSSVKEGASSPSNEDDKTAVRIVGNFHSSQSVQFRVSQLCADFSKMSVGDRRDRYHQKEERGDKSGEGAVSPTGSQ